MSVSTDPQCQSCGEDLLSVTHISQTENTRGSVFDFTDRSQGNGIEFVNTPLEGTIQHITTGFTHLLLYAVCFFFFFLLFKIFYLCFCQHHRFISDTTHTISSTSLCLSLQLLLPAAAVPQPQHLEIKKKKKKEVKTKK